MATDYDAPRRGDVDELSEDSLDELKARRAEAQSGTIDIDETELNESLELPGADLSNLSGEELTVRVLPKQDDEFTCSRCFLVRHRSRLARERNGRRDVVWYPEAAERVPARRLFFMPLVERCREARLDHRGSNRIDPDGGRQLAGQ